MQFERPIANSAQTQLQFSRNNVFCDEKITIQASAISSYWFIQTQA